MAEQQRTLVWSGPEHGDGETLHAAFRRLAGRDLDLSRCLFEDVRGMESTYCYKDGWEVTVRCQGPCEIARVLPGGGPRVCSAHRVAEPGCPLCGLPGPEGGAP